MKNSFSHPPLSHLHVGTNYNKKEKKNAYSFSMFLAEDSVRNELLEERALELKEYFQNNPESLKRLKKKLSELDWGFQKQLLNYLEQ